MRLSYAISLVRAVIIIVFACMAFPVVAQDAQAVGLQTSADTAYRAFHTFTAGIPITADGATRTAINADPAKDQLPAAMLALHRAAEAGDQKSAFQLGFAYALDTPFRDMDQSEKWLQIYASRPGPVLRGEYDGLGIDETPSAVLEALCMYYEGGGLLLKANNGAGETLYLSLDAPAKPDKVIPCLERESSEPRYALQLANAYERGLWVHPDTAKAAKIYQSVAEQITDRSTQLFALARLGLNLARRDAPRAYVYLRATEDYGRGVHDLGNWYDPVAMGANPALFNLVHAKLGIMHSTMTLQARIHGEKVLKAWEQSHPAGFIEPSVSYE